MRCAGLSALIFVFAALVAHAENGKYSIKTADTAPPKAISESIRKLLDKQSVQLLSPDGKQLAEVWLRSSVPADATPEQIKNGITYREIKQSEIIGVIRFDQDTADYRKQKVKAGTYTLRLGYQPADGDHQGSSLHKEFLVLVDPAKDTKPDLIDYKEMVELSMKTINTGHPAVFMLFPVPKPGPAPRLEAKAMNHWVLNTREEITVDGKKTGRRIGIGITLVGHAQ
ncbi:MAG: hypothetical protein FJ271_30595 [Planctomycetes bacterium]|nr:hypothetical protein [Planctomycetota bacterium]